MSRIAKQISDAWDRYRGAKFTRKRNLGDEFTKTLRLGAGKLASDWAAITDEAIKELPTNGGGVGIAAKWGDDYKRIGVLEFSEGSYGFSVPLKHVPMTCIKGPDSGNASKRVYISANSGFTGDYLVEGAFRSTGSAHANFQTSLKGVFIDGVNRVNRGLYWAASHGSYLEDVEIDRYNGGGVSTGIHVAAGSDDWTATRVVISKLLEVGGDSVTTYGWWFDDGVKCGSMRQLTITQCEVGMSFGTVEALTIDGFECENTGLPLEWREKNHDDISGNSADDTGNPSGCRVVGIRALRNSDDDYTTSTRVLAFVRQQSDRNRNVYLEGYSGDAAGNLPYDRVEVQINSGTKYTFPLRWDRGYDLTDWNDFDFSFDLAEMTKNLRFRSDNTKMQDSRLVSINNPATQTGAAGPTSIALEPGLYRIEIPSANTYGTDYTVTVNQTPGGAAVPGLNLVSAAVERYWHHPGGSMEWQVSGAVGSPSINIYFRPWMLA